MRATFFDQSPLDSPIPTQKEKIELDDKLFDEQWTEAVELDIDSAMGHQAVERLVTCVLPDGAPRIRTGIGSEVIGDAVGRFGNNSRDEHRLDDLYRKLTPETYEVHLDNTDMHLNMGLGRKAIDTTLPLVRFTKR